MLYDLAEVDVDVEERIAEADAVDDPLAAVRDLLTLASTHVIAYKALMIRKIEIGWLHDLAHAYDVPTRQPREDLAFTLVVAVRGLDEDEAAALDEWRRADLSERRRRAASFN